MESRFLAESHRLGITGLALQRQSRRRHYRYNRTNRRGARKRRRGIERQWLRSSALLPIVHMETSPTIALNCRIEQDGQS